MTTVLEAIRWELSTLRVRITCLEQAEVALGPLYEPMNPCQPAVLKADITKPAPRKPRRRGVTCAQVREHVIAHAPITRRELIEALGCPACAMDKKLRHLVANGEIGVDGQRDQRTYRSPNSPEVVSPPVSELLRISEPAMPPARGVYPMYDAIIDLDGATTEQLMKRTGLPTNLVVEQGRRLLQLGLVRFRGIGDARVWLPTQSELLCDAT